MDGHTGCIRCAQRKSFTATIVSSHPTASQHIRKKPRIHEVVLPPDIDLKFTADVAKVDRLL
jgi:hypothetical protein